MWHLLRTKCSKASCLLLYLILKDAHLNIVRDTIVQLLKKANPVGSDQRRKKKLKRRVYRNKILCVSYCNALGS